MTEPEQRAVTALERIEAKLDLILEKLKWVPESMAEWYAAQDW